MKKETREMIYSFVVEFAAVLFTIFILIVFGSCSSAKDIAADNYIKELETTLELNGIGIDDTVAGSDAYSEYYK